MGLPKWSRRRGQRNTGGDLDELRFSVRRTDVRADLFGDYLVAAGTGRTVRRGAQRVQRLAGTRIWRVGRVNRLFLCGSANPVWIPGQRAE
ncbi:hypothetical protein D3C73_1349260 [compost metagenome]